MSRLPARSLRDQSPAVQAEDVLFKPDRPRHIDRFIDYFGSTDAAGADPCGEAFLSTLEASGDDE